MNTNAIRAHKLVLQNSRLRLQARLDTTSMITMQHESNEVSNGLLNVVLRHVVL